MGILSRIFNVRRTRTQDITSPRWGFSWNNGVPVNAESAMQVSAYNRGLIYISSQVAKLPTYIKNSKNEILENDTVGFLMDVASNPEMSAMSFKLMMIQTAINQGNAYAEIERDNIGRPIALWPLQNDRVIVGRTVSGNLIYKVLTNSGEVYLSPKDIFHLPNFHTKDGIIGQGVAAYAIEILGISIGADKMANSLFNNGGLPSGVISVQGTLSDEAYEKIKNGWKAAHAGRKAGGVAVLEEGAKYEKVQFDPQMLQFLESRKFNVVEIARFLGVPPTKLFDTQAATYNNTENANLEVVTDTLDAWAKRWESEVDIKLLNGRFAGRKCELDLYAVSRGDMETRAKYFNTMIGMGAIQPNEIRQKEGMAGYTGGDKFYISSNNLSPVDRIDEIIDAQIKQKETPAKDVTPTKLEPPKNENLSKLEERLIEKLLDRK